LDRTLCRVNTSFRFGCFLLPRGYLSWKLPYLMSAYAFHKAGIRSTASLHQLACSHFFYKKSISSVKIDAETFLNLHLENMLNQKVVSWFQQAKMNGHYTILLSSSPHFLVKKIASRLGFHQSAGTQYRMMNEVYIDGIAVLMEGEKKASYLLKLMRDMSINKEQVIVYSDSYLDLPLLEVAGHPIPVNPDRKLRHYAAKKNWMAFYTQAIKK